MGIKVAYIASILLAFLYNSDILYLMARERDRDTVALRDIPVHRINGFVESDDYFTLKDEDVLRRELTKLGLFGKNFGYRAFNPERLDYVLQNGTDRDDDYLNLCEYDEREDKPPNKNIEVMFNVYF